MDLDRLSIEELMDLAHIDYMFGKTGFTQRSKRYMACSYIESIIDYGYDVPVEYKELPVFYGKTLREVIIKTIYYGRK